MMTSSPNYENKTRAAAQVAAWKLEVQSFFNDDWNRLRSLIMDLEEQTWDANPPADLDVGRDHGKSTMRTQRSFDGSASQMDHNHIASESRPVVKDRLTELAEQIERRLQSANTDGK